MPVIHTILDARPPARSDDIAWTTVRVEESAAASGPWTPTTTLILNPVDADPAAPDSRDLTFPSELTVGYFRLVWIDAALNESVPSAAVYDDGVAGGATAGTYTDVASLKAYTGLQALKDADDDWLSGAVIPQAEALLDSMGPFTSPTCPQLKLAANMLAEWIFEGNPPDVRNNAVTSAFRSESIGRYSYTRAEGGPASGRVTPWAEFQETILAVIGPCLSSEDGAVSSSNGILVFEPLRGYEYSDRGDLEHVFSIDHEQVPIRPYRVWR